VQTINERLRILRKSILGLTQNDLGKSIGVTGFTISDIEKGKRKLTERNLSAICDKYKVNKNWFLTGEGNPITEPDQGNKFLNAIKNATNNNDIFLQSIVTAYDSLSEDGKDYIYEFIKDIYENFLEFEKEDTISKTSDNKFLIPTEKFSMEEAATEEPLQDYDDMSVDELLALYTEHIQEANELRSAIKARQIEDLPEENQKIYINREAM